MSPTDLRRFVTLLEEHNELTRISTPANPLLEIAAITDRVCKNPGGGRALLFEHPIGSTFPVATNLFGSPERTCLALGISELSQLTTRLTELLHGLPAPDSTSLDRQIAALPEFACWLPAANQAPAWNLGMAEPDLTSFPFLQSWPGDGSASGHPRYITLPQVLTAAPDGGSPNCGMYRCQIHGPRELAIRWNQGSGASRHLEQFCALGKPLPVAIALGGPPAALFSAMLPLPGRLDEMTFAGFLQGTPIVTAACRTVPLQVPASAEIVIEGFVDPGEIVSEGPFGNHTGLYSPAGPAALLRVTAISHRPGAIIPATVVGVPPMEDCWMAKAWERLLLAFLKRLIPDVNDLHFPMEWIFHQSAIISLDQPNSCMVREIADRLWQLPWFRSARLTIFTDAARTPADSPDLSWRCINLVESETDLFRDSSGTRLALDATASCDRRQPVRHDPQTMELVSRRWREYGLN